MTVRTGSIAVIIMTAVVWVAWDVYAAIAGGTGDTISGVITDAAHRNPIIAAAAGILVGHWFWRPPYRPLG